MPSDSDHLAAASTEETVPTVPLRTPRRRSLRRHITRSPTANSRPATSACSSLSSPAASEAGPGSSVEVVHVGAAEGVHHGVLTRLARLPTRRSTIASRAASAVGASVTRPEVS